MGRRGAARPASNLNPAPAALRRRAEADVEQLIVRISWVQNRGRYARALRAVSTAGP